MSLGDDQLYQVTELPMNVAAWADLLLQVPMHGEEVQSESDAAAT